MSDLTEHDLREAFAGRVETVSPRIVHRLSRLDFQQPRRRVPLLTKIGATATGIAAAAAAAAAVLSLTAGTQVAFAGWTATPSAPSAAAVAATRIACGHVAAADVLASEARGPYTAIVFMRGNRPWQCVARGPRAVVDLSTPYPQRVYATVPSEKVMVPLVSRRVFGSTLKRLNRFASTWPDSELLAVMTGPGSVSVALGVAGSHVSGVTLTLKNGQQVQATVEHGWYVAWWPGAPRPGGAETTRIEVTTSSGTRSSHLPASPGKGPYRLSAKGCFPGDACSVLVPLGLTPGISPSIRRHFAIFTDTPEVKWSAEPQTLRTLIDGLASGGGAGSQSVFGEVQMENGVNYGLDLKQIRGLRLSSTDSMWLLPGTEGYCDDLVELGAGPGGGNITESSCSAVHDLLHSGYIQAIAGDGAKPYAIGGFIPDGNHTVTVRLDSGATRVIAVRHNTFVAHFDSVPVTVRFSNASGRAITEQVHMGT